MRVWEAPEAYRFSRPEFLVGIAFLDCDPFQILELLQALERMPEYSLRQATDYRFCNQQRHVARCPVFDR